MAEARLPTHYGEFKVHAFRDGEGKEHLALARGNWKPEDTVNVRMHSKCLTGDTFSSLRCDCRDQFERAMEYLAKQGGVLIYLDQEGRGIGLANKIKAYALQDEGHDTVEANQELGFEGDLRDYRVAARILQALGIRRIRLLTNNPGKVRSLKENGVEIVERIPLIAPLTPHNKKYIETKRKKMKHLF